MKSEMRKRITALTVLAVMAVAGAAFAAQPGWAGEARYYNVVEARKAQAGTLVSIRGRIMEELQSGKFLVRDASGYIVMDVDRNAPYYASIEKEVTILDHFNGKEEPTKHKTRSIVDPDAIVEIVGTVVNGAGANEIKAALIEVRRSKPAYSDAYNRIPGFNSND